MKKIEIKIEGERKNRGRKNATEKLPIGKLYIYCETYNTV